ncbi:ABC transporter permease [Porticoccus sp. W117]|uniref:ABC transporter permease n=1 Tax=Porticoccus sp. W117 TaxID=3054777 RepID=UPI00259A72A5|nr:ABC transporter permease [Porticoccus sp. W117]MDM3872618.1 ABC transporter permease [Porticoccus sp. W117]
MNWVKKHLEENFIITSLIALVLLFSIITPNFFSLTTLSTVLNQLPALTVITVGMTLVLIVGGIDLSVGSILGLSAAIVGAASISLGLPIWAACLLGITAGALCGAVNGIITSYFALPSFIVTLGMLEIARGLAYTTTASQTLYIGPQIQSIAFPMASSGVSVALIIAICIVAGAHYLLTRTIFGRYITAIGTNETAARLSGIETKPYRAIVLMISGAMAGLGGVFSAAYLGASDPNAGLGLELSAIAAAVIGGTSLMGGRGSVIGAFLGVLIIAVLQNGLAQIGATEPTKRLITGSVIIIAVLFDRWRSKHSSE